MAQQMRQVHRQFGVVHQDDARASGPVRSPGPPRRTAPCPPTRPSPHSPSSTRSRSTGRPHARPARRPQAAPSHRDPQSQHRDAPPPTRVSTGARTAAGAKAGNSGGKRSRLTPHSMTVCLGKQPTSHTPSGPLLTMVSKGPWQGAAPRQRSPALTAPKPAATGRAPVTGWETGGRRLRRGGTRRTRQDSARPGAARGTAVLEERVEPGRLEGEDRARLPTTRSARPAAAFATPAAGLAGGRRCDGNALGRPRGREAHAPPQQASAEGPLIALRICPHVALGNRKASPSPRHPLVGTCVRGSQGRTVARLRAG